MKKKSAVNSLWLLFLGALLNGIATMQLMPNEPALIVQLMGGVIGIVAVVRLSARNRFLKRAVVFMTAAYAALPASVALSLRLPSRLGIVGFVIWLTLLLISEFHQVYGLADMADGAGSGRHARDLRQYFMMYTILTVAGFILSMFFPSATITMILLIAGVILKAYQLLLYHITIRVERAYEARVAGESETG